MEQMSKEEFLKRCKEDKENLIKELEREIAYARYKKAFQDGKLVDADLLVGSIKHIY